MATVMTPARATMRATIFLSRPATISLLALVLAGCFFSEAPLISAQNATYPFASGTVLKRYDVSYENGTAQFKETAEPLINLLVDSEGYYKIKKDRFRLHEVERSPYYIMMLKIEDKPKTKNLFAYTVVEKMQGGFAIYKLTKEEFEKYKPTVKERDPYIWNSFSKHFQEVEGGKAIRLTSLEGAATILPHIVSRGFSSVIDWYKVVDSSSDSARFEAGMSATDTLSAKTALDQILGGLDANPFAEDLKHKHRAGKQILFKAGEHTYDFQVSAGRKHKNCTIIKTYDGRTVGYLDRGCTGTTDRKLQASGNLTDHLSAAEHKAYRLLVDEFAAFASAMMRYRKTNPQPEVSLGKQFKNLWLIPQNDQVLEETLQLMHKSSITEYLKNGRRVAIRFLSSNGYVFAFVAAAGNPDSCAITEVDPDDQRVYQDTDCDGGLDYVNAGGSRTFDKVDPVVHAKVYRNLLLDLRRFVRAAVQALPRQN